MTLKDQYNAALERVRIAKAEAHKLMTQAFHEGCKELFAAYPAIKSFGWTQFTPFFNDGDQCVFGVYSDYPMINGVDLNYDGFDDPEDKKVLEKEIKAIQQFVGQFHDEDLLEMFGDHQQIVVTPEGITQEDFEHE